MKTNVKLSLALLLVLSTGIALTNCTLFGPPGIKITNKPAVGSYSNLAGKVTGVKPGNCKVMAYIKVNGQWWVKPYFAEPYSPISLFGGWSVDVTTGGQDIKATDYKVALVPNGLQVPLCDGSLNEPQISGAIATATASR